MQRFIDGSFFVGCLVSSELSLHLRTLTLELRSWHIIKLQKEAKLPQ